MTDGQKEAVEKYKAQAPTEVLQAAKFEGGHLSMSEWMGKESVRSSAYLLSLIKDDQESKDLNDLYKLEGCIVTVESANDFLTKKDQRVSATANLTDFSPTSLTVKVVGEYLCHRVGGNPINSPLLVRCSKYDVRTWAGVFTRRPNVFP